MPNQLSLLVFFMVSVILSSIGFLVARKKKSHTIYRASLANAYVSEISAVFLLFVWYVESPLSTFTYNEESSLKVFLDFFTVYQITIFLLFKTLDSIVDYPFKTYILELKKVDLALTLKDWDSVKRLYDSIKKEDPKHYHHQFFHLKRKMLSLKIYLLLLGVKHLDSLNEIPGGIENLTDAKVRQLVEKGYLKNPDDGISDLKDYIATEIAKAEIYLEENSDQWSGSIFLRWAHKRQHLRIFEKFSKIKKKFNSKNIFVIINLIIMLLFLVTYYYYRHKLLYY